MGGRYGKQGEIKHDERLKASFPEPYDQIPHQAPLAEKQESGRSLIVREARPEDLPFVAALSGRVFSVFGQYEQAVADWFRTGGVHTYIAWEDQQPKGFVMISSLYYVSSVLSEIMAIAVSPGVQRRGLGKKLLLKAEESAAKAGAAFMLLHTAKNNIAARSFFSRNGYFVVTEKPRYYPAGQDGLRMIKKLEAETA